MNKWRKSPWALSQVSNGEWNNGILSLTHTHNHFLFFLSNILRPQLKSRSNQTKWKQHNFALSSMTLTHLVVDVRTSDKFVDSFQALIRWLKKKLNVECETWIKLLIQVLFLAKHTTTHAKMWNNILVLEIYAVKRQWVFKFHSLNAISLQFWFQWKIQIYCYFTIIMIMF